MRPQFWLPGIEALAVAVVATACVDRGVADRATVTDSAGISIVTNRLAGPALPRYVVSNSPLADIGGDESRETQLLFGVSGSARLADGRIVIAEEGGSRLRIYTAGGEWLADWGRAGDGPGEFRDIGRAYVVQDDSVIAWDSRLRRLSLFSGSGDFVRSWSLVPPPGGMAVSPVMLMERTQWLARPGFSFSSDMPTGLYRDSIPYLRFTLDGAFIDTIGRFPAQQNFLFNNSGNAMAGALPFLPGTHVAPAADGFWVCTADRFEVDRHAADGALVARVRVADANLDLEPGRFDAWTEDVLSDLPPDQRQVFERFVAAIPRPDRLPACTALVVDATAALWVRGHAWPGDEFAAWHIFDAGGRLIATASLPERLTVHAIGSDWLLGTWLDANDVEHVRLLRLEGSAARP